LRTFEIRNQDDLQGKVREVLVGGYPEVCDVWMQPDEVRAPCVTVTAGPDGQMVSGSLEEMWPPLEGGGR
jgi:hypothetical protein